MSGMFVQTSLMRSSAPDYDRQTLNIKYQHKQMEFGANKDYLNLSNTGKRLNLVINDNDSWQPVAGQTTNKSIKAMDKSISKAGQLLEQMKTIAETAKDPSLDDHDRLVLQMQIGRLQHELSVSSFASFAIAGVGGTKSGANNSELAAETMARQQLGAYEDSHAYKMLARALERVADGEAWDVAEIGHTVVERKLDNEPVTWQTGDTTLPLLGWDYLGEEWEITNDQAVPTVGEILKGKGRSVMDVESAAVTAAELEKDIKGLQKQRKALEGLIQETEGQFDPDGNLPSTATTNPVGNFFIRLSAFFDTLFRDPVQTTWGQAKDKNGNSVELDAKTVNSSSDLRGKSLISKATGDDWNEAKPYAYLDKAPDFNSASTLKDAVYWTGREERDSQ